MVEVLRVEMREAELDLPLDLSEPVCILDHDQPLCADHSEERNGEQV